MPSLPDCSTISVDDVVTLESRSVPEVEATVATELEVEVGGTVEGEVGGTMGVVPGVLESTPMKKSAAGPSPALVLAETRI